MKPSLVPTLQAMAEAGCTVEQIIAAVQAHEAGAAAARRAKTAEYVRRHRARKGKPHNDDVSLTSKPYTGDDVSLTGDVSLTRKPYSDDDPPFSEKDNSHPVPPQDIGLLFSEKEKDCQMAAGDVRLTGITPGQNGPPSPEKERSPPTPPSKEKQTLSLPLYNNPPTARARKSDLATPRAILEEALPADLADAVIRHRQALRKPLTAKASELLVRSLRDTGDPRAAAEMMIERGWQTIRPDWYENSKHSRGNYGIREDKSTSRAAWRLHERLKAAEQRGEDYDILAGYGGSAGGPTLELLPPERGD